MNVPLTVTNKIPPCRRDYSNQKNMIDLRFHPNSSITLLLSALFITLTLSSCSDDDTPFQDNNLNNGQKEIVFSVKTSSDWNNGTATRALSSITHSSSSDNYLPVLTLTSSLHSNLYLVPEIIDGINLPLKESEITPKNSETTRKYSESTRSSLTTNETISSFGVFASLRPNNSSSDTFKPDYMYNVEITKADGNSWAPKAEYLWPNEASLHINSYSPYSSEETLNSSEGITSLPSADETGNLSITWITPSEVANQQDLLWATPKDASSSPCDLTFNHALTAIKFVTGSEMIPCTVKKIEVTNVLSSGSLNLETGEWTPNDAVESYSVTPDVTLTATDGASYVASGTTITSDTETLLLLPQSLTESAEIILTIESNGTESTFNASLKDQIWTAGKTVIYRLSANPVSDSLILEILDAAGNSCTTLQSPYTGGNLNYTVSSHYSSTNGTASTITQIPWKAEFIDEDGNVIDRPQWITSLPLTGEGDTECSAPTVMQEPTFAAMSEDTRILRNTADINTSSGNTPYNLSNSTGASGIENTANCYIVSAPGKYSIPLVYGNAIKNGAANTSAYEWNTHTHNVLKNFINHLGNSITDPYIYNNAGCDPYDAYLVWEGRLCLIGNVGLSEDKKNLTFEVPATYIRQGNALLAVRDKDGNIMWSWQIWVIPYSAEEDMQTFSYSNHDYHIMSRNIGEVSGGDDTFFKAQSVRVCFTQITPETMNPKSIIVTINRNEKHVVTPFCYSFYQWGRKDPMISLIKEWYDAEHTEISAIPTQMYSDATMGNTYITSGILHPSVYMTGTHDIACDYSNLWNVESTNDGVKSIYDPSPVGFKMPGIMFRAFTSDYTSIYNTANASFPCLEFTLPTGSLNLALLGYRSSGNAQEEGIGKSGTVWTNLINNTRKEARCFQFEVTATYSPVTQFLTNPLLEGFGVRPIKDE